MRRILCAMVLLAGVLVNQPTADACGMGKSRYYEDIDVSKTLMVRARGLERAGEAQAALTVYQRLMFDNRVPMQRRSRAAFAAYRIHLQAGDLDMAMNRLKLAVGLWPHHEARHSEQQREVLERTPASVVAKLAR